MSHLLSPLQLEWEFWFWCHYSPLWHLFQIIYCFHYSCHIEKQSGCTAAVYDVIHVYSLLVLFFKVAKMFPGPIDLNNFGKYKLLLCSQMWGWEDVHFEMVIMWGFSFFPLFAARNPPFWGLETEFCLWWLSSQQDRNLSPLGILKPNTIQTNAVLTPCAGTAASSLT